MCNQTCEIIRGAPGVNFREQIPNNTTTKVTEIVNRISYDAVHALTANSPYISLHGIQFYIISAFSPEACSLLESQAGESANCVCR